MNFFLREEKMMKMTLEKADKDLFAVYQTMYSRADIEMWYDWKDRLDDTKWTDQCFFVVMDDVKIGGLLLLDDKIMYPFLISPFCDRVMFWSFILKQFGRGHINGVLEEDAYLLPMFDYKTERVNQVMCRPTDVIKVTLAEGFSCRPLDFEKDQAELGMVLSKGYAGGICEEIDGTAKPEEAIADLHRVLLIYSKRSYSKVITEKESGQIVAVCVAGTGEDYTHQFAEIADICVLPEFRGKGLAQYLIGTVTTEAMETSPFIKLFVYVGNRAEYVYRKMGFISGPRFTNMVKR